ncbi:glycosyltransferase [Aeromicrobium terrae]|uniref:Glycosyltransferase family 4 protein n=1 Tax=Aeromicrobium terrae TaxID=2498846 RepID=A0A5C8ND92_9ACTN|nr:glycosyltransferase [Aeromicrobium terrae]TXL57597.1 glycosyltransferase family 4 protein [Aeromicrobium terrae]
MHIVFDAFGIKPGSGSIVIGNMVQGWSELPHGDRITVLTEGESPFPLPPGVELQSVESPVSGKLGTAWRRSFGLRRKTKAIGADAVVCAVTASALAGTKAKRAVVVHDLRHELRPAQFSRQSRAVRAVTWGWSLRTADAVFTITGRTQDDLEKSRPWLKGRTTVAYYGADHVDTWGEPKPESPPWAVAFGQTSNKNVHEVLHGWALFCEKNDDMTLRLVAMSKADREVCTALVAELGIQDRVELMPFLEDKEFQRCFTGASLVIFPSDFEGFGLPAIEALRLRVPVVISTDPAVVEISGGHATIAHDIRPETLAAAMHEALERTPEQLDAGREYTESFKWSKMAQTIRDGILAS